MEQKISYRVYKTLHQNFQRAKLREKRTRKLLLPLLQIYFSKGFKKGRGNINKSNN